MKATPIRKLKGRTNGRKSVEVRVLSWAPFLPETLAPLEFLWGQGLPSRGAGHAPSATFRCKLKGPYNHADL